MNTQSKTIWKYLLSGTLLIFLFACLPEPENNFDDKVKRPPVKERTDTGPITFKPKAEDTLKNDPNSTYKTVVIKMMTFTPANIIIRKGDTIRWINQDIVPHNVTEALSEMWTSGEILQGNSWEMVPETDFDYICSIHPTMKGTVTIKE